MNRRYWKATFLCLFAMTAVLAGCHAYAQSDGAKHKSFIDSVNALSFQHITSNPVKTEPLLWKSKSLADSIGYHYGLAESLSGISLVLYYQGRYDESIEYNLEAIKVYERLEMFEKAGYAYAELGFRTRRRDLEQAESFMRMGLAILEDYHNSITQANAFNNYGLVKMEMNQYDSALYYVNRSLSIKKNQHDTLGIGYSYGYLGDIHLHLKNYDTAINYLKNAYKLKSLYQDSTGMSIDYQNLGEAYFQKQDYEAAIPYLRASAKMAFAVKYPLRAEFSYKTLSDAFEEMGRYDSALHHQEKFTELKSKRINERTNEKVAELQIQFETQQKEKELALKRAELSQEQLKVRQRNWFLGVMGGLLLTAFLISGLIFRQQKIKRENLKRENKLKIQLANAEMENKIHKERERISRDLHDNVGAYITNLITGLEISNLHLKNDQNKNALHLLTNLDEDARGAMNELRETIWLLNKEEVKQAEFINHLRDYIRRQKNYTQDLNIDLQNEVDAELLLNPAQSHQLLRIVQEALTNTIKYAEAQNFRINFKRENNHIEVELKDDGRGIKQEVDFMAGNGFKNMKQRAEELNGNLHIDSVAQEGVSIRLKFPLG
ncbi:MAG: tetratricopeptide repeat protein [Balneolaceae bacterium]|nr:tetratricopeptide repeat protein [Balneolaceae bacterium]